MNQSRYIATRGTLTPISSEVVMRHDEPSSGARVV